MGFVDNNAMLLDLSFANGFTCLRLANIFCVHLAEEAEWPSVVYCLDRDVNMYIFNPLEASDS